MWHLCQAALEWTAEYQNWGLNLPTLSVLIVAIFTVVESWGLIEQGRTIWRKKNVDSVESEMFLYTLPYFFLCAVYGYHLHSVSMILNAVLTGLLHLPILQGLIKFRGFSEKEKKVGSAYALMPMLEMWSNYWGLVYMFFAIGVWLPFWEQLRTLKKEGKTGAVDISLYIAYFWSCLAWLLFATQTGEMFFIVSLGGATTIITAIMLLWFWIRAHESNPHWLLLRARQLVEKVLP